jgi:signal peptidase II
MVTMTKSRFAVIVVLTVAADVMTKVIAVRELRDEAIDLGIIHLRLVYNDGVAFGVGAFIPPLLLVSLVGLLTIGLGVAMWRGVLPMSIATGLVLGGALGNLADRAVGGSVVDMFALEWWPAFNLADVGIVVGVTVLLLGSYWEPRHLASRSA